MACSGRLVGICWKTRVTPVITTGNVSVPVQPAFLSLYRQMTISREDTPPSPPPAPGRVLRPVQLTPQPLGIGEQNLLVWLTVGVRGLGVGGRTGTQHGEDCLARPLSLVPCPGRGAQGLLCPTEGQGGVPMGWPPARQPDAMTRGPVSSGPRKDSGGSGCQRVGRHRILAAQGRGVGEVGPECSMGKGRRKAEADSETLSGASCPPLFGQETKGGRSGWDRILSSSRCSQPEA